MITQNLKQTQNNIAEAAKKSGRTSDDILLVAVSKTKPLSALQEAYNAGIRDFGENKVQELCDKYDQLPKDIRWHMIGHLQTNKVKYVIGNASLIQSVDRLELAREISRLAVKAGITQDVLAEVNIGGEAQKGGIAPDELKDLISVISELPGIRVKGLMCVPPAVGEEEARRYFASMRRLFEDIASAGIPGVDMRELSMGMSGDYKSAIKEGATMVRVGTAIFGARPAAVARA